MTEIRGPRTPAEYCFTAFCGFLGICTFVFFCVLFASIHTLDVDEQVVVKSASGWWTREGPWKGVLDPFKKKEFRKATLLQMTDFAHIKHVRTGVRRSVEGPQLLFIDAYEEILTAGAKPVLQPMEYILVKNVKTGDLTTHNGPQIFFPGPYDEVKKHENKRLLEATEYALVKNTQTGDIRVVEGPQLFFPSAFDLIESITSKIILKRHEYTRLFDKQTGEERVVIGPMSFVPLPTEHNPYGVQRGVNVDTDTAVLVLRKSTGDQRLITEEGVFIPGAYEEVQQERPLIHVEPHEAIIVRSNTGNFIVHTGAPVGTAFFLQPFFQIFQMKWSTYSNSDASNSVQKRTVTRIDFRVQKVYFTYEVRTSDNVKLSISGTIFWQVNDVSKMINATADPEGDVWHHSRSALIQEVSRVTFNTFMSGFESLATKAFSQQANDTFYLDRGVEVQSLEVTRYALEDAETREVLQEIIRETTNRINRLQLQESENEVRAAKLEADILLEKQRTELIQAQAQNERLLAETAGESGGLNVAKNAATFMDGLNESLPDVEERLSIYRMHETMKSKNQDTQALARGKATIFLAPKDMNLKLDMKHPEAH